MRLPDAALLIIGPASTGMALLDANRSNELSLPEAFHPRKLESYFNALDGRRSCEGITTEQIRIQIKVVEYSACRKIVVSTPLANVEASCVAQRVTGGAERHSMPCVRAGSHHEMAKRWDRFVEPYKLVYSCESHRRRASRRARGKITDAHRHVFGHAT